MTKEVYKGVEIRRYGTKVGEGIYPLCFTDNLKDNSSKKPVLHDDIDCAMEYIDENI